MIYNWIIRLKVVDTLNKWAYPFSEVFWNRLDSSWYLYIQILAYSKLLAIQSCSVPSTDPSAVWFPTRGPLSCIPIDGDSVAKLASVLSLARATTVTAWRHWADDIQISSNTRIVASQSTVRGLPTITSRYLESEVRQKVLHGITFIMYSCKFRPTYRSYIT